MSQVSAADADRRAEIAQARRRVTTPASIGLLLLRLGFAAVVFVHGLAAALHLDRFTEKALLHRPDRLTDQVRAVDSPVPVRASIAAAVVVVLALLLAVFIAVGFLTRVAGGLLLVLAGLVWWSVHHAAGSYVSLSDPQRPITGEILVLVAVVGLALVFTGPGRFAADAGFRRSRDGSDGAAASGSGSGRPDGSDRDAGWQADTTAGSRRTRKRADGERAGAARAGADRPLPDDPSAWTDEDVKRL